MGSFVEILIWKIKKSNTKKEKEKSIEEILNKKVFFLGNLLKQERKINT